MIRPYQVGFAFEGAPGDKVTRKVEMTEACFRPEKIIASSTGDVSPAEATKCIREMRIISANVVGDKETTVLKVGEGISILDAEALRHQGQHEGQAQILTSAHADKGGWIEIDAVLPPSGKLRLMLIGPGRS